MSHALPIAGRRFLPFTLLVLVSCGGGGKTYSAQIGAAGGSLVGPGGASVAVPAGALTTTVTIAMTPAPTAHRPTGTASAATPIHLAPDGQTFDKPVDVTIPIDPTTLPSGRTVDDVVVVRAPHGSSAAVPLPTRRVGNAVVCQTEHFSDFIAVVVQGDGGMPFGQCGDSMCVGGETCSSCPFDCGLCLDGGVVADAGAIDAGPPVDAGAGTDAGPASHFVDNGDGSATDSITTLQWEVAPVTSLVVLSTAVATCTALAIGGHTDWRLPTAFESLTLVDFTRVNPALDTSIFPGTPAQYIWTSTLVAAGNANVVLSTGASISSYVPTFPGAGAWCVRGADVRPAPAFVDNGDLTVTDTGSGLMYTKNVRPAATYAAAQSDCATLSLGVAGTWRIPTLLEMFRTARYDLSPALDTTIFMSNGSYNYWTSTPDVANPTTSVWYWEQTTGSNGVAPISGSEPYRCVR